MHKFPVMLTFPLSFLNLATVEPVPICELSSSQVNEFVAVPMIVPAYPAHIEGVECMANEVTAAPAAEFERRGGFNCKRTAHRKLMPVFASKHDLVDLLQNATE